MDDQASMDAFIKRVVAVNNTTKAIAPRKNYAHAPDAYDGSRAGYETFRRNAVLYADGIPAEADKITAILSFCTKGDADAWAQNYTNEYHDSVKNGTVTWAEFLEALDKKFLDPRVAEYAREQLFKLTQGKTEADIFFLKFDELRNKGQLTAEHHDVILVEHLKKHMNPRLVLSVQQAHEANRKSRLSVLDLLLATKAISTDKADAPRKQLEKSITYDEFRTLAIEQDPVIRRFGGDHSGYTPKVYTEPRRYAPVNSVTTTYTQTTAPAPTPTVSTTTPAKEPDVIPMDVDRQQHRDQRKCYRCQKTGHIARFCKERDMREVIRGLTEADINEIIRMRETPSKEGESSFANPQ